MDSKEYYKDGKIVEIGFEDDVNYDSVLFKMHYPNNITPAYYSPKHIFADNKAVVEHILDNLETDGLRIEVIPCKNKQIKY